MKGLSKLICCLVLLGLCPSTHAQNQLIADNQYVCPPCNDGACDNIAHDEAGKCPACGMKLIKKVNMKNVAIFIHDGVEILDFSGPGEVFAAARPTDGAFHVYTVSLSTDPIVSQGFVKILPEYSIDNCPKPDIIVLPGGNTGPVAKNPKVIDWVKTHGPDLDVILSVCTGAFILQKTGLLDGKKATTWHGALSSFKSVATKTEVLENTRWVDNGQVVTTAGVSAGIDGALRIVEKMFGRPVAKATARYMEYDKWDPEDGVIVEKK